MRIKRIVSVFLCLMLLGGCTIGEKKIDFSFVGPFTVFTMGKLTCRKPEAQIYILTYKNLYDKVGDTDLFDGDFDVSRVQDRITRAAINHLSEIYMLNLYAKENDIKLEEADKRRGSAAAVKFMESVGEEDAQKLGINLKKIRKMYENYAVAIKVYSQVIGAIDEEVSEDEARIMDAYVLYVENKKTFKKLKRDLKNGASFDRLLATYCEGDKGIISFGKGEYPKEVEEAAFALKNGEISEGIKAEDGYYFIYCVDKYNEELSEENKKKIVQKRKDDLLNKIISEQKGEYNSHLNENLVEKLSTSAEDLETDEFFTIIEEQFGGQ